MQTATAWDGKYILVYTGALGRVDRTALSKRESPALLWISGTEQNVFIRPDNLQLSLNELNQQPSSLVWIKAHDFSGQRDRSAHPCISTLGYSWPASNLFEYQPGN